MLAERTRYSSLSFQNNVLANTAANLRCIIYKTCDHLLKLSLPDLHFFKLFN